MLALFLKCRSPRLASGLHRSIFSLPNLSSFSPLGSSGPQKYTESKRLPFTPKELYDVVSDVGSYPKFVPFCTSSRILTKPREISSDSDKQVLEAELTVGFLAFKESYVSTVTCKPYRSVEATATSSTPLFKTLSTIWHFEPSNAWEKSPSTMVSLDLVYDFANPLHAVVSSQFFGQVSQLMITAFEDRCRQIYHRRK